MTLNPRHDPSDVATKADLAELRAATQADTAEWRAATKADLADMRADMTEWRDVMRADIAALRSETRQRIERVEDGLNAVNRRMDRLLHALLAGFLAVAAALVGVIVVVL